MSFCPVNMSCIMIALTIHAKSVLPDDLETILVEQASSSVQKKRTAEKSSSKKKKDIDKESDDKAYRGVIIFHSQ